jgi:glycosyltransferase involved in cell wall biosynthesis
MECRDRNKEINMKMNELISVIIPVYNVEKYLYRCIDSVLTQSYTNLEIILIDDGSPDKCPEICDKYAKKDSRIQVIHQHNKGPSSARNAGLNIMSGQYVTFLDSDDFWHSDFLKILYSECISNSCDITECEYIHGTQSEFPPIPIDYSFQLYQKNIFILYKAKTITWGKLYKSNLWSDIRFPIGKYYEDDFTTWKLYYKARQIALINIPLYYYFINQNSTMQKNIKTVKMDFVDAYIERLDFFSKKGEKQLYNISKERLCTNLMLTYIGITDRKNNKKGLDDLLRLFNENVVEILWCLDISLKTRIFYRLFKAFPQICMFFVQTFKLRK